MIGERSRCRGRGRSAGLVTRLGWRRVWGPSGVPSGAPFGAGRDAFGAAAPVDDLCFVDFVAGVVGRSQAWHVPDGAVDVDHPPAGAADQVMVVVADPVFV